MTAGPWTPVNELKGRILRGEIDFSTATLKCALFLSTSNIGVGSTTFAALTNEHANANGYVTTGVSVEIDLIGTADIGAQFAVNPTWVAVGGNIVARTAVLYEVGGHVLWFCTLDNTPADVTVTPGNRLTIDSDGTPDFVFSL